MLADLKSETSGKFEDILKALMTPLPEFLAKELHYAMEGIGTNEETIIEIVCTASNAEIYAIKQAYEKSKLAKLIFMLYLIAVSLAQIYKGLLKLFDLNYYFCRLINGSL